MGNSFSDPERCDRCSVREPGEVVWKIQYSNWNVTNYCNNMKSQLSVENISTFFLDKRSVFDVARQECDKIPVGHIRLYFRDKVDMVQYLCNKCYSELSLDDLPSEWGYECDYLETGWRHFSLP